MQRAARAISGFRSKRWHAVCLAAALFTSAHSARAERPVNLAYDAPPGCGSATEVRSKLASARQGSEGAVPEGSAPPETGGAVDARVVVNGEGQRYQVDFEAESDGVKSRRRLVVDSCEAVTEAAALLLLLTMDPVLARALGVEEPASSPDVATTPSDVEASAEPSAGTNPPAPSAALGEQRAPVDDPVDELSPRDRSPGTANEEGHSLGGWMGIGPGLVHGMTPAMSLGPAVSVGLGYGALRLSGSAGWHRAWTADLRGVEGGSVEAELLRAGAGVGVQFGTPGLQVGPVVGVGFERMTARARGISTPGEGSTSWPTLRGGVGLNALISEPWALSAEVGAVLPLSRPSFRVEGEPEAAHQPARVGAEASVAISWAWGSQF